MSRLNELLKVVEQVNPQLALDLRKEYAALSKRRSFGLNFERHAPESVELPGRPVRPWDKVRILPERGAAPHSSDPRTWTVVALSPPGPGRTATIAENVQPGIETQPELREIALEELVVFAESTDKIYPGLISTGAVTRGGDRPFHAVINAENLDALRTLIFTHAGKVDAIYIDPPYNTGARDWKYNNDYVDGEDGYRHSKWLAFMERRLKLAQKLLNPLDSVLVVAIDEREGHRLGLLLEQTFPEARVQMVSTVMNPKGVPKAKEFSRVDEWLYFVMLGDARPALWTTDMMSDAQDGDTTNVRYVNLKREGSNWKRSDRPSLFYPIFVNTANGQIAEFGDPLPLQVDRQQVADRPGLMTVWPLKPNGAEARWQQKPSSARALLEKGLLRSRLTRDGSSVQIDYLSAGQQQFLEDGRLVTTGRDEHGALIVEPGVGGMQIPKTIWRQVSHSATEHGSKLLTALVGDRAFPFPKSLYAVEDTLRFFVADKPDATIVDFFAGSGSTAHAVMRLNRQDGGRRKSISVTNNEVSVEEQSRLRKNGLRPGDPEWEAIGICDFITKPRIEAAITGVTPAGEQIKGDYRFNDEFPMRDGFMENVEFFTLTYEAPRPVAQNKSFAAIAPLLWLRAGGVGRRIERIAGPFDVADVYGILFDLDHSRMFLESIAEASPEVRIAYIVTDDEPAFQAVADKLPREVEAVRLYEAYLTNFRYNAGIDS